MGEGLQATTRVSQLSPALVVVSEDLGDAKGEGFTALSLRLAGIATLDLGLAGSPAHDQRKSSSTLEELPNEGPFSVYLVITDVVAEEENTSCWGTCEINSVKKFPFPQDRVLIFQPVYEDSPITKLWFIPALDRPPSSNIYYVINAEGKYRGKSCICSRDMDIEPTRFGTSIKDTRPSHFDPRDTYQVFQIHHHNNRGFFAESMAPDGFPPKHLRKKSWEVRTSQSLQPHLEEALGLDMTLRACLPDFTFPISGNHQACAPVVVGKWYCPCVFVRDEDVETKHQIKKSMFYKMTLEQKWEELHTSVDNGDPSFEPVPFAICWLKHPVGAVGGDSALTETSLDPFPLPTAENGEDMEEDVARQKEGGNNQILAFNGDSV
ncbi:hypothetical protein NL676_005358 [Syzygium grande]|nr:hypothetical protein NL676_005358 [Syzygium grande]